MLLEGGRLLKPTKRPFEVIEVASDPPFLLTGAGGPINPVTDYLLELSASDCSRLTIKSYAFDLLDWFRYLDRVEILWDRAEREHVRDYVLGLRSADNPYRKRSRATSPAPGSVNERTGKPYLAKGYAPATINHRLSVIRSFYAFHLRQNGRPLVNPVPSETPRGARRNAHHRSGEPWTAERRSPYRQRRDKRLPRAIPDHLCDEVYRALTNDRDRAIVSLLLSGAARAAELLGMTGQDIDWGRKCVRLITKGTRTGEWVAASPDFFRWLLLYLVERGPVARTEPLWLTLREPRRPLGYSALRAVITRVNKRLETNLVLHDFRHTCAIRLANDPRLPITDVQTHLRHKHLSSTETYLVARPEEVIERVQEHHRADSHEPPDKMRANWTYDAADLQILLGHQGEAS